MKSLLIKAGVIAAIPVWPLRRVLYRSLMGFEIAEGAKIAWLTVVAVPKFRIGEGSTIGPLNFFKGPIEVNIGKKARIQRQNLFTCSWHVTDPRFADRGYSPVLRLGDETLILNNHFFDCYGVVEMGNGSWVAGSHSQFWTHGLSARDRDIHIGEGNYIGTAVRFAPGSSIGDRNIVALGSVVMGKVKGDESLISGFPAKAIRSIAEDVASGRYRFTFEDW